MSVAGTGGRRRPRRRRRGRVRGRPRPPEGSVSALDDRIARPDWTAPRDLHRPMTSSLRLPELAFTKTTLANGLDVIVRRQGPLPLVAVNLWYHVGSKDEERRQRGFAHLFEHLMFEGSEHYPGDFF